MKFIFFLLIQVCTLSVAIANQSDVMHFISYGQSLSIGSVARPIQTDHQRYNNITFKSGVVYQAYAPNYDRTSFKPLVEDSITNHGVAIGETPGSAAADVSASFMGKMYYDAGLSFLVTAPSAGGLSIDQISKNTAPYQRMIQDIDAAKKITTEEGKTYNVQAILFSHGEEDTYLNTSGEQYIKNVNSLMRDIAIDVKKITGQSFAPHFIVYQVASHRYYKKIYPEIALAQYKLEQSNNNYTIATPMYIFDYSIDHLHLRGWSSWILGAYYGKVYSKKYLNNEDWSPLTIKSVKAYGNYIDVKFNIPVPPIKIDTSVVSIAKNYGFSVRNSYNVEFNVIKEIKITGDDSIRIVVDDVIPDDAHLTYAFGNNDDVAGGGRINGARGNIRDSDMFTAESPDGKDHVLHNWLLISDVKINK